ncbi:hypothetical protein ONS95_001386 [Cadophora gregata]|uniref:uncharacterized protein n=1 Tax=Cadophora gregata TaxID=51156 RepID=UPI0026DB44DA|nr:uncharacterized protein ONS95_001386 [Cadophora gregata]KAK0111006.1 hypothetical protein ONS95_001386 [Cadophora gregata]
MSQATSSNDGSVSPELREKMKGLAKVLFPRWSEVCDLTWKIGAIQDERVRLLMTEVYPCPIFRDIR